MEERFSRDREFKILPNKTVNLNRLTCRRLKIIDSLQIDFRTDADKASANFFDIMKDEAKSRLLIETLFESDFKDDDLGEVDLFEVEDALVSFFLRSKPQTQSTETLTTSE
ncbi:MAG TPA: hypothetical protein VMV56_09620 [Williamwhitmania sp.]|nr:hypothetical protein [Williamwhitmania sp.]